MSKRGLSTVIVTLILILLGIVLSGVVWVVVSNVVESGAEEISLGNFFMDLEITQVKMQDGGSAVVGVKRNPGEGTLSKIKFLVTDGENTIVIDKDASGFGQLETRSFTLGRDELSGIAFVKGVSIAPVILENGNEKVGREVDKITFNLDSCKDILDSGLSRGDGIYVIDPKGENLNVYCDMTTDDGGWTLIASYVNGDFFNDCTDVGMAYGSSCSSVCSEFADGEGNCDEQSEMDIQDSEIEKLKNKMIIDESVGSLDNYQNEDFVSPAYYSVSFTESMFSNDQDEYISYNFGSANSMKDFYTNKNTNHLELRFPPEDSDLDTSVNACDTLELAVMMADNDGRDVVDYSLNKYRRYSPARTGPGWDSSNNGGCHYDDNSGIWMNRRLGGQNNEVSQYILWFVR